VVRSIAVAQDSSGNAVYTVEFDSIYSGILDRIGRKLPAADIVSYPDASKLGGGGTVDNTIPPAWGGSNDPPPDNWPPIDNDPGVIDPLPPEPPPLPDPEPFPDQPCCQPPGGSGSGGGGVAPIPVEQGVAVAAAAYSTTVDVALLSANPGAAGGTWDIALYEVTGISYQRVSVSLTNSAGAGQSPVYSNPTDVYWPVASQMWGDVACVALIKDGVVVAVNPVGIIRVPEGTSVRIPAGTMSLQVGTL
jgi:hypothetical protein